MKSLSLKRRRDIKVQRLQFAAVLVTIVLGVMMFAASYDAYENLSISYNSTYERLAFADATVSGGDPGLANALKSVDGVAKVEEREQADVPIKVGEEVFLGRVVSVPAGEQPDVNRLDVVEGEYPIAGATARGLVETHMAAFFELAPGDSVSVLAQLGWRDLEVAGEVVSPEYLWPARSNQQFFEPPGDFGVVFATPDVLEAVDQSQVVPQTLVVYEAGADSDAVDEDVRSAARDHSATDVLVQADQPSNKGLSLDVTGFQQMAVFFPGIFLLVAGLAAYTLLTRVVYSQRTVIGTLRANGFGQREVLRHYLSYGLWLGLVGAAVGVALGLPAGWAMTAAYTTELGIPDTVRELRWITPVIGVAFGAAVGALSAWVPARSAVRLAPADAIRGDVKVPRGHRSTIERVVRPLSRAPVQWRMVFRSIGRSKRRSLTVVLGIVLAMTLVFTAWGMVDTVRILLARQFTEIQLYDADVATSVPVNDQVLAELEAVSGVELAEPVVALPCSLKGPDGSYSTTLFAFLEDTRVHGFVSRDGKRPEWGALMGSAIGDKTGAGVGDSVEISLPTFDTSFDADIEDLVTEPMGSPVYVTREVLEAELAKSGIEGWETALQQPGVSLVRVVFEDGVDRETVVDDVAALDEVVSASDAQAIYLLIQDYMGLFYLLVGIMLVFGGILALALIFNIVSVNLSERIGELATMRANGLSHWRIAAFVLAENMILTAMGVVPGAIVAYAAASWLMSTYTSDMLSFNLEFYPSSMVLSALSMFVVTAVSLWPGVRAVRRLDIATEVRERSQ